MRGRGLQAFLTGVGFRPHSRSALEASGAGGGASTAPRPQGAPPLRSAELGNRNAPTAGGVRGGPSGGAWPPRAPPLRRAGAPPSRPLRNPEVGARGGAAGEARRGGAVWSSGRAGERPGGEPVRGRRRAAFAVQVSSRGGRGRRSEPGLVPVARRLMGTRLAGLRG